MPKQKYYVVWEGHEIGICDSWETCKQWIANYPNAKYKSFKSKAQALDAYEKGYYNYLKFGAIQPLPKGVNKNSICVDAASSGNPGKMEYRGVDTVSRKPIFHQGPFPKGTNNIGEFLAIVHALALIKQKNSSRVVYTDSTIAMGWVKRKKCKTKLIKDRQTAELFELIDRAESWLKNTDFSTKIIKWPTQQWGEIPADFGRK